MSNFGATWNLSHDHFVIAFIRIISRHIVFTRDSFVATENTMEIDTRAEITILRGLIKLSALAPILPILSWEVIQGVTRTA